MFQIYSKIISYWTSVFFLFINSKYSTLFDTVSQVSLKALKKESYLKLSVYLFFLCLTRINAEWHACLVLPCLWSTEALSWTRPWGTAPQSVFTKPSQCPTETCPRYLKVLVFCLCLGVYLHDLCSTWLISLVQAAFSCRDGASNTTVKEDESDGSTTSLKSSWPNTWPPAFAVIDEKQWAF